MFYKKLIFAKSEKSRHKHHLHSCLYFGHAYTSSAFLPSAVFVAGYETDVRGSALFSCLRFSICKNVAPPAISSGVAVIFGTPETLLNMGIAEAAH